jgi:hypothetical protein
MRDDDQWGCPALTCPKIDFKNHRHDRKRILLVQNRLAQSDLSTVNEGAIAAAQVAYSQFMTVEKSKHNDGDSRAVQPASAGSRVLGR